MSCLLVFMKRSPKEIEIFGGEVYVDIDGKNVGIVGIDNLKLNISEGMHKIKMYKSHTYGTFIGMSEAVIELKNKEELLIKYTPPMLVSQPGNIIITDYVSDNQVQDIVAENENIIRNEHQQKQRNIQEQEEKNRNGMIIFIVIIVISAVIWGIYMGSITNP